MVLCQSFGAKENLLSEWAKADPAFMSCESVIVVVKSDGLLNRIYDDDRSLAFVMNAITETVKDRNILTGRVAATEAVTAILSFKFPKIAHIVPWKLSRGDMSMNIALRWPKNWGVHLHHMNRFTIETATKRIIAFLIWNLSPSSRTNFLRGFKTAFSNLNGISLLAVAIRSSANKKSADLSTLKGV